MRGVVSRPARSSTLEVKRIARRGGTLPAATAAATTLPLPLATRLTAGRTAAGVLRLRPVQRVSVRPPRLRMTAVTVMAAMAAVASVPPVAPAAPARFGRGRGRRKLRLRAVRLVHVSPVGTRVRPVVARRPAAVTVRRLRLVDPAVKAR